MSVINTLNTSGLLILTLSIKKHPLSSKIVSTYTSGQRETKTESVTPCFHECSYGGVPPAGATVIEPSQSPLQLTELLVKSAVKLFKSNISKESIYSHPNPSVTM